MVTHVFFFLFWLLFVEAIKTGNNNIKLPEVRAAEGPTPGLDADDLGGCQSGRNW
jgi:hypothetical protein